MCKLHGLLGYNEYNPTTTTTTTMNMTLYTVLPPIVFLLLFVVLHELSRVIVARRSAGAAAAANASAMVVAAGAAGAMAAADERRRRIFEDAVKREGGHQRPEIVAKERAAATKAWVEEHRVRAAEVKRLLRERQRARTRASERHAAAANLANDLTKARATITELEWRLAKSARARMSWDPLDREFGVAETPRKRLAAIEAAQRLLLGRMSALEEVKRQFRAVDHGVRVAPRRSARLKARAGPRRSARLAARARG